MSKWKWLLGLGTVAAGEYALARYFFRRTILRCNASSERTQDMAGTNWELYIPKIRENHEWMMTMPLENVEIRSRDGLKLSGTFMACEGADTTVLCFHGYSSRGMTDYPSLAKFYHGLGYHVLVVDQRGHGDSEGEYITFGCLDRFDALAWIHYLEKRFGENQSIVLHGISMGGATVLMTSGLKLPSCVKAIVSDCAFTSAWDVFSSVLKSMYHLPPFPLMQISDVMAKNEAGFGLAECNAAEEVKNSTVPILFIHGDSDTFVPCRMCYESYENCSSPKDILIIEGAGHAESYYKDTASYEAKVKAFLNSGGAES